MRATLIFLCFLIQTFAIWQDVVDKINTLRTEPSPSGKAILEEYHKHPKNYNQTHVNNRGDSICEVNKKTHIAESLYQMDIVLTPEQIQQLQKTTSRSKTRTRRQAYRDFRYPNTIWSNNVVNYYFANDLSNKARTAIQKAIQFWQENTCIDFRHGTRAYDKILFINGDGCYSNVGKTGGTQIISIGWGCEELGTTIHEIGHALGFFHTMSRHDRDSYITLDRANIERGYTDQFDIETTSTNFNYGLNYDFGSIMHYGARSASKDGVKAVIIANDGRYQSTMGSEIVSFVDVSMMNEHYQCKVKCNPSTSVQCRNGGYPHPRDCSKCICPSGFAGKRCTERPSGCGEILTAQSRRQPLTASFGHGTREMLLEFQLCHYMITAPLGKKIEVRVSEITAPSCNDGCTHGGLEIKGHTDVGMTGFRYCCPQSRNTVITSPGNVLPIIVFSRYRKTYFTLEYRSLDGGSMNGPVLDVLSSQKNQDKKTTQPPSNNGGRSSTNNNKGECSDLSGCDLWTKSLRLCETYPETIRRSLCPKSCGLC